MIISGSLTFEPIKLIYQNEIYYHEEDIIFYISGILYKKNDDSEELVDTSSILYERIPLYENRTINRYHEKYEKFTLIFKNIPRKDNFNYDLRIQVYSSIENELLIQNNYHE